ncbi:bifunctional lysylphosphatidylglycerol flippase/synthetase MprF [Kitasatospora sp. NPDC004745]|uniref:bifunctional lysylphosphatidylglycerol flippase/synthetase MprF n=1 Tax=Kitasatospora sp. NPDC004745 TaxID=3364019 RepID=UPI0036A1155B
MPGETKPQRVRAARTAAAATVRRFPFTVAVCAVILVTGLAVGGLWHSVSDRSWYPDVAYGLPSFEAGRWWTPVTGAVLCATPVDYLLVLLGAALLVGLAESRLGTRWAAAVTVAGQLGAVLLAALLLLVLRRTSWSWAVEQSHALDVGLSAGALCAGAVVSAALASPWRQRLRLGLIAYVGVWLLYVGGLVELEHALAVAGGLLATHWLRVPGAHPTSGHLSRREWRLLAVAGLVLIATILVVVRLSPSRGPLGDTAGQGGSAWNVLISVALIALLVNGLRQGRRLSWQWTVLLCLVNALLGLVVAVVYVIGKILGEQVTVTGAAVFVPTAVLWTAELLVLLVGREAFQARRPHRWLPHRSGAGRTAAGGTAAGGSPGAGRPAPAAEAPPQEQAADLLMRRGGGNLSWMTTWPDNSYFFTRGGGPSGNGPPRDVPSWTGPAGGASPGNAPAGGAPAGTDGDGEGYIAYRTHAGVAVALGDPVGAAPGRAATITGFAEMCDRAGLVPCLFSAGEETAAVTDRLGWRAAQVAEDTVIELPDLEFRGKAWQDVRTALNRARKEGVEFRLVALADQPRQIQSQVRGISEEWVGDKGLPEMGFTLGGVEEALDPRMRVGLAMDADDHIHGVTSWMPVYAEDASPRGWTLDMMRRRDGFRPVVEFMIASSCLALREDGARFLSLSGAPLARTGTADSPTVLDRILDQLGGAMEPYYGFRSLHAFKAKFQPRYEPMYLLYRDEADLPRIGLSLLRCYLPSASVRDLLKVPAHRA